MPHALWYKTLLLITIGVLSACAHTPPFHQDAADSDLHYIYLIHEDWHTSILIAAPPLLAHSEKLALDFSNPQFIRVGWGDGDYFTGKSKHWTTAAKALVASNYSALQVMAYRTDPRSRMAAGTIIPLAISDAGMRELTAYIDESIAMNEQGLAIHLDPAVPDSNLFYQSTVHYSAITNCNTWSSRALKRAGLPINSTLRLTAKSVVAQAQRISSAQHGAHFLELLVSQGAP